MATIKDNTDIKLQPIPKKHNFKDITNQTFGRLNVIGFCGRNNRSQAMWLCRCECGNNAIAFGHSLRKGIKKSCGCLFKEIQSTAHKTHGLRKNKLYATWSQIKNRCFNTNYKKFNDWGGRGITMFADWSYDYFIFHKYVMDTIGECPSPQHSIDRIDNSKGYFPGNIRWATATEQGRNKRNNTLISFDGSTLCISEWASKKNISATALWYRIFKLEWCIECALSTPASIGRNSHICTHCVETASNQ